MNKLAVVTTYYNPCRYKTRRENYDVFKSHMADSGVYCLTVECVFGDEKPELPASEDVLHLTAQSTLWQKERLLNIAASHLPDDVDAVAWLDCDIVFSNPNWVSDTLSALGRAPIAQLFETCIRLDKFGNIGKKPDVVESFASVMQYFPASMDLARYDIHGHTGYAWAMRREIFDNVGLYEHAISGSADHFMAHAIFNDYNFCIQNALKSDPVQIGHLKEWGERFFHYTKGKISVVPGQIHHLWHGDLKHRNYFNRMHDITDLGYNPWEDIVIKEGHPIEWAPSMNKPKLKAYFYNFFSNRKEDGEDVNTHASSCQCHKETA